MNWSKSCGENHDIINPPLKIDCIIRQNIVIRNIDEYLLIYFLIYNRRNKVSFYTYKRIYFSNENTWIFPKIFLKSNEYFLVEKAKNLSRCFILADPTRMIDYQIPKFHRRNIDVFSDIRPAITCP